MAFLQTYFILGGGGVAVIRWVSSVGIDGRATVKTRTPLIAMCLVMTCVQRAGTIWGLVVQETAWL